MDERLRVFPLRFAISELEGFISRLFKAEDYLVTLK